MSFLADRSAVSIGLGGIPSLRSGTGGLNPSLDLNFAVSKSLDPRITFTRASEARYYDASTVAVAEQNLLLRSQDYSATWTVTNLTPVTAKTAPDATLTATEFTAGAANATLTQAVTAAAGDHTFSVWLRRVTGTGNVDITAHSGGTWVTQTLTTSWARYTVTQTLTAGSRTPGIRVVTSGDVIEVWGAQLEQRSTVTAYTPTTTAAVTNYIPVLQTAANGVARFDHNPVTRESLGLLIEEQRTNLLLRSEEFNNAAWAKTNLTINANAVVSPDGTADADVLVENTATAAHDIYASLTLTAASHTFSVYVKPNGRSWVNLFVFQSGGATNAVWFDISSGTIGTVAAGTTASITHSGNGWYRCSITFTALAAAASAYVRLSTGNNVSTYTGDGYSGIYIWGAQLEAGAFPTSYIPTVASQVTRSADAASMTGTNFSSWYRQDEGTFFAEITKPMNTTFFPSVCRVTPSSGSGYMEVDGGASATIPRFVVVDNSNNASANLTIGSAWTEGSNKMIASYKLNDFAGSGNGGAVQADTSGLVPNGITQIVFGGLGNQSMNSTIKRIAYYPVRLANATLQSLTA